MRITRVNTYLMRAGSWISSDPGTTASDTRHWLFVTLETEEGLVGLGEGSGWPKVVQTAVEDLAPLIIGEDASQIERLWQRLFSAMSAHGMVGTVGGGALAAIEMALWDLKGKALGAPVWNLLGGRLRDRVPVYAHARNADQARRYVGQGYRAIKCGGVDGVVELARSIREAIGPAADLMVDLHGPPWMTPAEAIEVGRRLEPLKLLFLEDAVAPEFPDGLARVRDAVDIPLAAGERLPNIWAFKPLLDRGLIDVAQPDTGRFSGILQMRRLAAMAEAQGVTIAPHSGSLGPVAEYAALHVLASIPNALMLETFAEDWPGRYEVVRPRPTVIDGDMMVPDAPGLGVELVLEAVRSHPPGRNVALTKSHSKSGASEPAYVRAALRTPPPPRGDSR